MSRAVDGRFPSFQAYRPRKLLPGDDCGEFQRSNRPGIILTDLARSKHTKPVVASPASDERDEVQRSNRPYIDSVAYYVTSARLSVHRPSKRRYALVT